MQLTGHLLTTTLKHHMKFTTKSLTTQLTYPLFSEDQQTVATQKL
jgi:hypothetical protein